MVSKTTLLGAAGEYFAMSQLLRRGFIAALAPAGVPNCDIVVTDDIGDKLNAVQVKARIEKGSDGGWHMRRKHEEIVSKNLFYAFVDFGSSVDAVPKCFVVPSDVVARVIRESHALWLRTPGKYGQPHKDGDLRRFLPDYDKVGLAIGCGCGWLDQYQDAWDMLDK